MKKIIESELISIAHRILKLKDKADIYALYNESKNVFEKISVLKFYEDNKFRIDPSITDEIIEKALSTPKDDKVEVFQDITLSSSQLNIENAENIKDINFSNDLIQDSEIPNGTASDLLIPDQTINEIQEEKTDFDLAPEVTSFISVDVDMEFEIKTDKRIEEIPVVTEMQNPLLNVSDVTIEEKVSIVDIDPVYNVQLEEIEFEQKVEEIIEVNTTLNPDEDASKSANLENQHLMNSAEGYEMPFHQVPLNRTINDAFSHVITVGLNDRIAFEKNLFDGSSEDLNRVLSQLNTIENFQEAQDFIEDLVKPDFNYWKGKEEYEERFMQLIQKRF